MTLLRRVGGWLDAADGMGRRHGTDAAAVELADALRRACR